MELQEFEAVTSYKTLLIQKPAVHQNFSISAVQK